MSNLKPVSPEALERAKKTVEGAGYVVIRKERVKELTVSQVMPRHEMLALADPTAKQESALKAMWEAMQVPLREETTVTMTEDKATGDKIITSSIIVVNTGEAA